MNRFAWAVLGISCAVPLAAQDVKVYTPSRTSDAPVYTNGQVIRVDRAAGTVTLRSDTGTNVMRVDRQTLASLDGVRAGSNVIVGFRVSGTGRTETRTITDIRPSSGVALQRSRVSANASQTATGARSIGTAQVVSVDAAGRRLTVTDSNGATRVLDVRGAAVNNLGGLQAGDQVSLGVAAPLVSGTPAGTVTSIGSGTGPEALSFQPRPGQPNPPVMPQGGGETFTNSSLPRTPGLPPAPSSGISRNPAATGVQPAPPAQPLPGVQGPTGLQPVPGAQPLPGTGVTGRNAPNPGLATQPVPGSGGQPGVNAGATGGTTPGTAGGSPDGISSTGVNNGNVANGNAINGTAANGNPAVTGNAALSGAGVANGNAINGVAPNGSPAITGNAANGGVNATGNTASRSGVGTPNSVGIGGLAGSTGTRGATGTGQSGANAANGATNSGVVGGGSPILGGVPQLGGGYPVSGINSQIPSVPSPATGTSEVLPLSSVSPQTYPPRNPAELAQVRELASRDFDLSVAVLAARAAEVDRAWLAHRGSCVTTTLPLNSRSREWFGVLDGSIAGPTEDVCESSFNEVLRQARSLQAALDNARDTARRADVLPGRMREALQRYNLDI